MQSRKGRGIRPGFGEEKLKLGRANGDEKGELLY